ncbi:MAG: glutamate--tRNA ligase [Actinobacteria bacterium]|nr:glutamate--tRNA ligase [Actinomycetota bacterium]
MSNEIRVRFAPSPTGELHLGSARTALFNWLFAKSKGGKYILRIEDTDIVRSSSDFEKSIINDLKWLGLDWDEGPGVDGSYGPYRQSERQKVYQAYAKKLIDAGIAYKCYSTLEELEEKKRQSLSKGIASKYDGRCRDLSDEEKKKFESAGRKAAIRFKIPSTKVVIDDLIRGHIEFESDVFGDFVIVRSNGSPSFNFAVVVDDIEMKISHIIRGEDHLTNTARHILLFKALGASVPKFAHISMIFGTDGAKLSKRHGATAVNEYRKLGYLSSALINYLALLGWSPEDEKEIFDLNDLISLYTIERMSKSPAVFNLEKLNWINGQHIRSLPVEELTELVVPFLEEDKFLKDKLSLYNKDTLIKIVEAISSNLVTLKDAPVYARMFFEEKVILNDELKELLESEQSRLVLNEFLKILRETNLSSKEILKEIGSKMKEVGIKGKNVYMPIRVVLTGKTSGPELFYILEIFGKEKCIKLIERCMDYGL